MTLKQVDIHQDKKAAQAWAAFLCEMSFFVQTIYGIVTIER